MSPKVSPFWALWRGGGGIEMKLAIIPYTQLQAMMLMMVVLVDTWILADGYDPLDPNGNITVTFDIHHWTDDGYMAIVTIQNYYQYRHVEKPGWSLGWNWNKGEIIWSLTGALAAFQGNCSDFKTRIPHSCRRDPVIVDLNPEALPGNPPAGCCRGGLLTAQAIDPTNSSSSFEIEVGNLGKAAAYIPDNLVLLAPEEGYTCSPLAEVPPTIVMVVGGKREEQVFRTWRSACTYSTFIAKEPTSCCVSLSTFYNPEITPCRSCACECQASPTCNGEGELPTQMGILPITGMIGCTDHMCPVRVHWHVKSNYKDHWKVKLTVSNYNFAHNYTRWNLVVQHPGLSQPALAYKFNSTKLLTVGKMDEAAIFWGSKNSDELLQAGEGEPGSVTTDILMGKDRDTFTLENGWALPRRIYFNGRTCDMPMPDTYPGLPNVASVPLDARYLSFVLVTLVIIL